ncbi:MAG TPA: hypothetical protein VGP37_02600, partial [Candidatus Nanopelagicales bacterium]|nr:hypothetical protein [Candidatus Nanopelagicales bacterium]
MDLPNVPRTVLGLTWREHIGGRWAVSALGFAISAPIAFLAVFVNVQRFDTAELGQWAIASAVSLAVMGGLWWLASVTVLRNRRTSPAPVLLVVLVGAISGAVRSIVATTMTVEWGLFPAANGLGDLLLARAAVGTAQGAVGLPVLAMSLSVINRYRSERAQLLKQLASVQQRRSEEEGAAKALRDALSGPVQVRLRELADRLGEDATAIGAIATDVRTQAHELWRQSQHVSDPPRLRIKELLRMSLSARPLPLSALWLVWIPSTTLTLLTRSAALTALSQVLVGALLLLSVYVLGTRLVQRYPRLGPLVFLVGTMGGAALAGIVMLLMVGGALTDGNIALIAVSTLWLAAVTLVVSVVESAVRRSEQVLSDIAASIDADEIALQQQQQVRSDLSQEVAGVLHGVVQGRLVVAQRSTDGALARQALDEGIELLNSPSITTATTAEDVVQEVSRPWSALMEIQTDVDAGSIPASRVRDVSDLIEECLSNAFRHGVAQRVTVVMRNEGDAWLVQVSDDGSGFSPTSTTG